MDDTIANASSKKNTELAANPYYQGDFTAELSESEIFGLMEMREEEKPA